MSPRLSRPVSHKPSALTITLAAVIVGAVLLGLAVLAWVAPRGVPFLHYYDVRGQFTDAAQIADLSQVRIAGRDVGQVTGTSYDDGHAVVSIALYPGQGPLRSDTRARIRLQGLLGGKYVELMPGVHGGEMPNDSTLPLSQTSTAVDLIEFFQTFNAATRQNLQVSLRGLGEGFLGRGDNIAQALNSSPSFLSHLAATAAAVDAVPGAAARLFPDLESLASAYEPVAGPLAAGFSPEQQVMQDFVDRRTALRQTLSDAPGSLSTLHSGLQTATPLLQQTAGLARALVSLTKPAPAALAEATTLLQQAGPALRATDPALHSLNTDVQPTLTFLHDVDPVIGPASSTLQTSLAPLNELGQHGCDVLDWATNWRSALAFGVSTGSGPLYAGEPGLGPLTSLRVLPVRLLSELDADAPVHSLPPHDPYPAPCTAVSEHTP